MGSTNGRRAANARAASVSARVTAKRRSPTVIQMRGALAWLGAGEAPGSTMLVGGTLVLGALLANELLGFQQRNNTP